MGLNTSHEHCRTYRSNAQVESADTLSSELSFLAVAPALSKRAPTLFHSVHMPHSNLSTRWLKSP